MAMRDVVTDRLLAGMTDPDGGPMLVRLVTADPVPYLTIPAAGIENYVPQAGDIWLAGVLRPAGVPVQVPGWNPYGQVPDVADEQQRVGGLALFTRVLADGAPEPLVASFPGARWARLVLRVYRGQLGEGNAVAAAAVETEIDPAIAAAAVAETAHAG